MTHPRIELEWFDDAACAQVDSALWFPEKGHSIDGGKAKRTCRACPVRAKCLAYALDEEIPFGIWGGVTERDRRRMMKRKGAA